MSTGTALVQDAARLIGAHSILAPLDDDSIVLGVEVLNNMMQLWLSQDIKLAFVPLEVPASNMAEPGDARNAIVEQLALQLAPYFFNGKSVVTPDLKMRARVDFMWLKNLYQTFDIPNRTVSATLPKGEGNSKGVDRQIFFGNNATINDSGSVA